MAIKVGDSLPSAMMHDGSPGTKVDLKEIFAGKKGVLFGVPGAYTPTCTSAHVPSYVNVTAEQWKEKGVEVVVCMAVNDAFVFSAWAGTFGETSVKFLADPCSEATKAMGLAFDAPPLLEALGNPRCKRFVMGLDDGKVVGLNISGEDGKTDEHTFATAALEFF
eukprot:CAMPEP_0204322392 /NCGR_PEP_ID=MMETSP0469-20131031/8661_1 /ASSEMBLY_ACC=CAM_ASM_000384 /TAXON_ID=2969 /ORGANISM="Oxyrrhis marina" /LENGTH=163 /DNA_ID=CAMNT_0051303733 /DNA_START=54 /DNA_END=545 /DNA_ORIENTATION=+